MFGSGIGAAEVFFFIGQLEFFYDQSPDVMRSLCSALSLLTTALGNYLSSLILSMVTYFTTRGGKPGWIPDNLNEYRKPLKNHLYHNIQKQKMVYFQGLHFELKLVACSTACSYLGFRFQTREAPALAVLEKYHDAKRWICWEKRNYG
ncbi:peptide transporter PTR2-like protein [Tanacetum coccineum]|uniref:Peptide transporter PTR2-like protein n=1 Tax=Tanacetum coccineum TaxID=301880 RepID=A0ABQ5ETJ7_9ASTR